MKSLHLIAALALPLAACGSTSKSSVQPGPVEPIQAAPVEAAPAPNEGMDPIQRLEQGCEADVRSLGLFQQFGINTTSIAAAGIQHLPQVAAALASQDKATLVGMCGAEDTAAYVMPRGTWLEVSAIGTETVTFGEQELEVELMTCEIISAPDDRHVGQSITMPLGWLQGRVVID